MIYIKDNFIPEVLFKSLQKYLSNGEFDTVNFWRKRLPYKRIFTTF